MARSTADEAAKSPCVAAPRCAAGGSVSHWPRGHCCCFAVRLPPLRLGGLLKGLLHRAALCSCTRASIYSCACSCCRPARAGGGHASNGSSDGSSDGSSNGSLPERAGGGHAARPREDGVPARLHVAHVPEHAHAVRKEPLQVTKNRHMSHQNTVARRLRWPSLRPRCGDCRYIDGSKLGPRTRAGGCNRAVRRAV